MRKKYARFYRFLLFISILKHVDDVQSLKTNSTQFAQYKLKIQNVIEFFDFQSLMQNPLCFVYYFQLSREPRIVL